MCRYTYYTTLPMTFLELNRLCQETDIDDDFILNINNSLIIPCVPFEFSKTLLHESPLDIVE